MAPKLVLSLEAPDAGKRYDAGAVRGQGIGLLGSLGYPQRRLGVAEHRSAPRRAIQMVRRTHWRFVFNRPSPGIRAGTVRAVLAADLAAVDAPQRDEDTRDSLLGLGKTDLGKTGFTQYAAVSPFLNDLNADAASRVQMIEMDGKQLRHDFRKHSFKHGHPSKAFLRDNRDYGSSFGRCIVPGFSGSGPGPPLLFLREAPPGRGR